MNEQRTLPSTQTVRAGQMQNLLREFIFIFFDRLTLIVTVFLVIVLLSLAAALLLPSVYRATAKFSITMPQSLDPLQQETSFDYRNRTTRILRDQKELILSNRVLEPVALQFFGDSAGNLDKTLDQMRQKLLVMPPKGETYEGSTTFHVIYEANTALRSSEITEAIASSYMTTYGDVAKERADYSYKFFIDQTEQLEAKMMQKDQELREYETRQAGALLEIINLRSSANSKEIGPNAQLSQVTQKLQNLQEEQAGLRATIAAIERELENNAIPVVLPEMEVHGRSISMLKNKVAQLQMDLNEMKPRYTEEFELVQQLQKTLDLNIGLLRDELRRTLRAKQITSQALQAQMQELSGIVAELKLHITGTANEKAVYEHLLHESNIAREAYIRSRTQLEQARLSSSLNQEKQNITLVDKPMPPSKPYSPNRMLILALGIAAGFCVAIGTALTVDHFDHTIKKPQDIETYLGAPFLGALSRNQDAARSR